MIILVIFQKQTFDKIAMPPRGTLGLCCLHNTKLMTHLVVYTLPFTFQLCYKHLGILQRVTKSQKVHISSHDVLQKKLHNIEISSHDQLQKSHTCEEGEVHLRITVWHLLMNLKNNYLLKRTIGVLNFNICNVVLKKKRKKEKNTWRYHYFTPVYQKS